MEQTRREFVRATILGALVAFGAGTIRRNAVLPIPGSVEVAQPESPWTVKVADSRGGIVEFTLGQLEAMPSRTVTAPLYCDDSLVTQGDWVGVSLGTLLGQPGTSTGLASVGFVAQDGYATSVTATEAANPDIILAYALNGSPLPEVLRLVMPGEEGNRWIREVDSMTLSFAEGEDDLGDSTAATRASSQTVASNESNADVASALVAQSFGTAVVAATVLFAFGIVAYTMLHRRRNQNAGS